MRLQWALLGVVIIAAPVQARDRVALVIANSAYQKVAKLKNPNADGALVADALRKSGFTSVEVVRDLDKAGMDAALQRFGNKADSADIAMVYFAGHGIETSGRNYLIPVSARLLRDRDAEFEAVALDSVLRVTEGARMRVIILDACRENPFDSSMARSSGTRSVSRGLSRVEPEGNTLIAYAAKAGSLAADGGGANSPFATALAKRLVEPGVEVRLLFGKVRDDVMAATNRAQEPFTYGSLSGTEFYFVPRAEGAISGGNTPAVEPLLWQGAMQLGTAEAYQDYLNRYPNGVFAGQAKQNLVRLSKQSQAAVATVVAGATGKGAGPERWGLTAAEMSALLGTDILKKANFASRVAEVEAAAKSGDATAAYLVGAGYSNGIGYAKDDVAAQLWFIRSGEAGSARGARAAGAAYALGQGTAKNAAEAVRWYERAIKGGDPSAINNMGVLYQTGDGVPKDLKKAFDHYRRAAEAGEPLGMRNLGYLYEIGEGVDKNEVEARRWYLAAAAVGDATAMRNVGNLYFNGRGVAADRAEAMRWFLQAATAGDTDAMVSLGYAYDTGEGLAKDYAQALRWYKTAADGGNATGMRNLAIMYQNGKGTPTNRTEAVNWFRRSAEAGNVASMTSLGFAYDQGQGGLTQDYAQAMRWYRAAANAGDANGMKNVGYMYRDGAGVPVDLVEAFKWLGKAANAGDPDAMNSYGYAYNYGRGTPQNLTEAVRWYRGAAKGGVARGMGNLAMMYKNGNGVARDPALAAWWYKKAFEAGYTNAKADYDALVAAGVTPRPE